MNRRGEGSTLYAMRQPLRGADAVREAARYSRSRLWQRIAFWTVLGGSAALLVGSLLIPWLGAWG